MGNPDDTPSAAAQPKSILFVGDMHCGGYYGLWPRAWLADAGFRDLAGARYLAECWEHHLAWIDELCPDGVDLLFLMGDLLEGKNRKSESTGLYTASLGEQSQGAVELLRPLAARARVVLRVDGTPYHDGFDNALAALDEALGVTRRQQVFDVQLPGGVLNVAHHPAGGSALYQGTKLDKEAVWSSVAAARRQVPQARWIVRAHLHNYALMQSQAHTVLVNACWKLQDSYAKKGNLWAWKETIGSVLMQADDSEPGGYRFRPLLYEPLLPTVDDAAALLAGAAS